MTNTPPRYADPATVTCPTCDQTPPELCVDRNDAPRRRWHVARTRVPAVYQCAVCGKPCCISGLTGALIHTSALVRADSTHNAQAVI